ncbi:MAG: histidine--tRNA ligase [Gemmatimonadaceae bacterium 4484_173]|nr:MAG: histidine--tRNA ligase [Gemmatimonadaceae bacterium 4484_173]RKZ04854.1 MAG: histidine--tRNA ligase [Candidatus Fermentibacteria bacterium]
MALSTKPLSGMRQRFPEQFRVEKFVTDVLSGSSVSAGFQEYDGPVIEPLALFAAKSGGELVGRQSYSFTDRGEREVILRPEMTPSLARMVASSGELQLPVRWFSMPLCYRYERPQRGRVREFLQFNLDILGSNSLAAELEVILVLNGIMKSFDAPSSIYRIGWSSRRFMTEALLRCGVKQELHSGVFSAIDKKDKMKDEAWSDYLLQACGGDKKVAGTVVSLVSVESLSDSWLVNLMAESPAFNEVQEFDLLLEKTGISSALFSPGVVRGLDYYTGIVFELVDTGSENRRSLCGGGRYDNLVGLFGAGRISGVGFGLGVLTLTLFLESYGLIPESVKQAAPADVYIAVASSSVIADAGLLAETLRNSGIRVMMDVSGKKLGKQFSEASRNRITQVITVGVEEAETGIYKMKYLPDGKVTAGSVEELIGILK